MPVRSCGEVQQPPLVKAQTDQCFFSLFFIFIIVCFQEQIVLVFRPLEFPIRVGDDRLCAVTTWEKGADDGPDKQRGPFTDPIKAPQGAL